jgi:hypothetical protein
VGLDFDIENWNDYSIKCGILDRKSGTEYGIMRVKR